MDLACGAALLPEATANLKETIEWQKSKRFGTSTGPGKQSRDFSAKEEKFQQTTQIFDWDHKALHPKNEDESEID